MLEKDVQDSYGVVPDIHTLLSAEVKFMESDYCCVTLSLVWHPSCALLSVRNDFEGSDGPLSRAAQGHDHKRHPTLAYVYISLSWHGRPSWGSPQQGCYYPIGWQALAL